MTGGEGREARVNEMWVAVPQTYFHVSTRKLWIRVVAAFSYSVSRLESKYDIQEDINIVPLL